MLVKSKLNSIEVLISEALINSSFSHNEFALINNVLITIKRHVSNCFKYSKNTTECKNPKVKTKNGGIIVLSKYVVCDSKMSKFIKEQEARGLLNKLTGIKVPIVSNSPIANILF